MQSSNMTAVNGGVHRRVGLEIYSTVESKLVWLVMDLLLLRPRYMKRVVVRKSKYLMMQTNSAE